MSSISSVDDPPSSGLSCIVAILRLHGVAADGGAFQEIGKAEGVPIGACSTTNGLQQFGEALSEGGAVAQGIDGVVAGAQSGNILAAITSGLGGVAGVAGLANDSTIQQYAAVGQELGSTALAGQSGNILAALDGLVQAANTSGVLSAIEQDVNALWISFIAKVSGAAANSVSRIGAVPLDPAEVSSLNSNGTQAGIDIFDPTLLTNLPIEEGIQALIGNPTALSALDSAAGDASGAYLVGGHGSPDLMSSSPFAGGQIADAETMAATIMAQPGYRAGEAVILIACDTAGQPLNTYTPAFAQQLADYLGAPVSGANNTLWMNNLGSYAITAGVQQSDGSFTSPKLGLVPGLYTPSNTGNLVQFQPEYGRIGEGH